MHGRLQTSNHFRFGACNFFIPYMWIHGRVILHLCALLSTMIPQYLRRSYFRKESIPFSDRACNKSKRYELKVKQFFFIFYDFLRFLSANLGNLAQNVLISENRKVYKCICFIIRFKTRTDNCKWFQDFTWNCIEKKNYFMVNFYNGRTFKKDL